MIIKLKKQKQLLKLNLFCINNYINSFRNNINRNFIQVYPKIKEIENIVKYNLDQYSLQEYEKMYNDLVIIINEINNYNSKQKEEKKILVAVISDYLYFIIMIIIINIIESKLMVIL